MNSDRAVDGVDEACSKSVGAGGIALAESVLGASKEAGCYPNDPFAADMVLVQGGTFMMGATQERGGDTYDLEKPTHKVTLSDFYISKYEVTQALWEAVMGDNPSSFRGGTLPVECVNWVDVQGFILKLNAMTGKNYRLPTEAEWEFAARGGVKSKGFKYSGSNALDEVAWYWGNSGNKTSPVGTKNPNELGLFDMSGNVWELCSDWYGRYGSGSETNPKGPTSGLFRISRGGSWCSNEERHLLVSTRVTYTPGVRCQRQGFRLARSL